MNKYRFVGSGPCEVGDRVFDRVGAQAEFSEAFAKDVLAGGGCFIPEQDFQSLDFDEMELQARPWSFTEPSKDFTDKLARAQNIARELIHNASKD